MSIRIAQHLTRPVVLSLATVFLMSGPTISAQESNSDHILLDQLRVIVGDGTVLENAAVLLQGDTIIAVGPSADMDIPEDTNRVDLAGKTLMPTLIDAHAHLGYEGTSSWGAQNYTRDNIVEQLQRYAYYGFGAVLSAGSDPDILALEIQRQQAAGEIGGARFLFAAGMAPPGQGPNNQFLVEALAVQQQTGNTILRGLANEAQAREAVRAVAEMEIPFIKLWVDDRNGSQLKLSPAIYRAVIAEATDLGIATVVHQQFAEDMPDLIAAGVRGFLHGRLENGFTPEIAIAARQNDVFIVPNLGLAELRREAIGDDPFLSHTLPPDTALRMSESEQRLRVPVRDPQLEQTLRNSFAMLLNANVDVVLGTDAGAVRDHPYGYVGHRELEIFVRHGMSPAQAIGAATSVAASALGLQNSGQIKAGFRADLLILDQNPLEDIRHTRSIHRVYLGGALLDRDAILEEIR